MSEWRKVQDILYCPLLWNLTVNSLLIESDQRGAGIVADITIASMLLAAEDSS